MILNRKLKIHDVENKLRPHPPHQPVMKNKKLDSGSLRPRSPVQVLKDYPIEKKKNSLSLFQQNQPSPGLNSMSLHF